jgi:hypothetical protein
LYVLKSYKLLLYSVADGEKKNIYRVLNEPDRRVSNGFIWLMIRTSGGVL